VRKVETVRELYNADANGATKVLRSTLSGAYVVSEWRSER